MTNQVQGELLFGGWEGNATASTWAYTPWMPVRGDFATFCVELVSVSSVTLTWEVQTRTAEDPTVTVLAGATGTISSAGVSSALNTAACKQWVRYRFSTGGTVSTTNYVVFRALPPSWQVDR
jgi:hypothetical protein